MTRSLCLTSCLALLCSSLLNAGSPELNKKLHDSVLYMDAQGVKDLLSQGADANYVDGGRSLLGSAAQSDSTAVVEALLAAGANPNFVDNVGHTPLMRAVEMQQVAVVVALLKAKTDFGIRDRKGRTVALMAVENGKAEIVKALLNAGADFSLADPEGNTPALLAAQGSGEEIYEMIALMGARKVDLNRSNAAYTPLFYAIEQGNARLVTALLKAGADANAPTQGGQLPLVAAMSNAPILKLLIEAKANPNATDGNGVPVLFEALNASTTEPLKALIKAGADLKAKDKGGRTPLTYAKEMHLTEMIEVLRRNGAVDPNESVPAKSMETRGQQASGNESGTFPKLNVVQRLERGGSQVTYFSGASVKELTEFYRAELVKQRWQSGDVQSDGQNYAMLNFTRDTERLGISLSLESGRTPARVMVDIVPQGSLRVADLPRYGGTTAMFEQDAIAIYVTADPLPKVADETGNLLKTAGWSGGLTAQTPEMRHLTYTRDGNELTVQVSIAPAQGNKTTIQYSLRKL